MGDQLTPKQVARAIGVSEASLKRWCDKGLIDTARTAGGHRRLTLSSVLAFLRAAGHRLVDPAVLGLPATCGGGEAVVERGVQHVVEALAAGDEQRVRCIAYDLFLAGRSLAEICDRTLATAMHAIGEHWQEGRIDIYQERRAVEVCTRTLNEMVRLTPCPEEDAPYAMGAVLDGDPYTLPGLMVELALRESGWRADWFGIGHPPDTLIRAVSHRRPRLFWLPVSTISDRTAFLTAYGRLQDAVKRIGGVMVVGGRALTDEIRREMEYQMFCDQLRHLVAFAETLYKK